MSLSRSSKLDHNVIQSGIVLDRCASKGSSTDDNSAIQFMKEHLPDHSHPNEEDGKNNIQTLDSVSQDIQSSSSSSTTSTTSPSNTKTIFLSYEQNQSDPSKSSTEDPSPTGFCLGKFHPIGTLLPQVVPSFVTPSSKMTTLTEKLVLHKSYYLDTSQKRSTSTLSISPIQEHISIKAGDNHLSQSSPPDEGNPITFYALSTSSLSLQALPATRQSTVIPNSSESPLLPPSSNISSVPTNKSFDSPTPFSLVSPPIHSERSTTPATTSSSIVRTLTYYMTKPSNRSCADCKATLIDTSQVYVSISPIFKQRRQQQRSRKNMKRSRHFCDAKKTQFPLFAETHRMYDPSSPSYLEENEPLERFHIEQMREEHLQRSEGKSTHCIDTKNHQKINYEEKKAEEDEDDLPMDPAILAASYIGGFGVFLCAMCGMAHKLLGSEFAIVLAEQDTIHWRSEYLQILMNSGGGNTRSNNILERYLSPKQEKRIRPHSDSIFASRVSFVRAKYQAMAFVLPPSVGPLASNAWEQIVQINHPAVWGNLAPWVKSLALSSLDQFNGFHQSYRPTSDSSDDVGQGDLNAWNYSNINNSKINSTKSYLTNIRHNHFILRSHSTEESFASDGASEKDERIKSRSRSLELPDRLVDAFCVITASQYLETKFLNDQRGFKMKKQPKSPKDVVLQPIVSDCFPTPENSQSNNSVDNHHDFEFPEHIATFVFPEGCRPSATQLPPTFYTFVLTNASGDRLYGAALRIYDDVQDIAWLRQAFLNHSDEWGGVLPTWMLQEVSEANHDCNHDLSESPPSTSPDIYSREQSLGSTSRKRADSDSSVVINNLDSQSYKINAIASFTMPEGVELLHDSGSLDQQQQQDLSLSKKNCTMQSSSDVIFLPKCLVVLSHHPFFDLFRKFLLQLYRITLIEAPLPIERFIANFVCEVPLPPPGKVQVNFGFTLNDTWIIERPPENELPMANFSYLPLFTTLSIPNVLTVFGCLLQESRVALVSEHFALLGPTAEALLSLLFPFHWQGMYLPLMPYNMLDILDAPVPYLVGLHSRYLSEVAPNDRPKGVVFVDLDNDIVHLGYEDRDFKQIPRRPPCFPERQIMKLKSKLLEYASCVYIPPPSHTTTGRMHRPSTITVGDGQNFDPVNDRRFTYAIGEHNNSAATMSSLGHSHTNTLQSSYIHRHDVLAKTDKAYSDNELLTPITGFLFELGQFSERDIKKKRKSSGSGRKFAFLHRQFSKQTAPSQSKFSNHSFDDDGNSVHLLDIDEPAGFSSIEIRHAFLRFFVSILRKYREYVGQDNKSNNKIFRSAEFLLYVSHHMSINSVQFFHGLFQTQMFHAFIDERIHYPNDSEVLFFDESIIEKQNRSTKKAITNISKGCILKKQTSFLHDTTSKVINVFSPPPPSNWGLPDDGRTYCYGSFPKLDPDRFGKVRPPMNWSHSTPTSSTSLRKLRRPAAKTSQHEQSFLRKALLLPNTTVPYTTAQGAVQSIVRVGVRNLESAISVLSTPFGNSARTTISKLYEDESSKSKFPRRGSGSNSSVSDVTLSSTLEVTPENLSSAEEIVWNARRKQAILIGIMIKFQSFCRMQLVRHECRDLMMRSNIQKQLASPSPGFYQTLRRQNAAVPIQSMFRCRRNRTAFVQIRKIIIEIQCRIRGRRVRLAYILLIGILSRFQAVVRGHLIRNSISAIISKRMRLYQSQIFELWNDSQTPLSFRSKFWPILKSTRFLQLSLAERELTRLWNVLNFDLSNILTNAQSYQDKSLLANLENKLGLSSLCVWNALKVHALLNIARGHGNSMLVKTNNVPKRIGSFCTSLSSDRVHAERLQIYERLCHSDIFNDSLDDWFQAFRIDEKSKQKKIALAETVWCQTENADASVRFMMILFPELKVSCNISFSTPSTKGQRRFQVLNPLPPQLEPPFLVDTLLSDRIRRNVTEVANLSLRKVPSLMSKLSDKQEIQRTWSKTYSTRLEPVKSIHGLDTLQKAGYFIIAYYFK